MSRHEIHIQLSKVSMCISLVVTVFLIINAAFFIVLPMISQNPQYLFFLGFMSVIHMMAFNNCITDLIRGRKELESTLKKISKSDDTPYPPPTFKEIIEHSITSAKETDDDDDDKT